MNMSAFVRPGVKFNHITEELRETAMYLTSNDHLIVIAGANNMKKTSIKNFMDEVNELRSNVYHTNLLLSTIPM